MTQGCVLKIGDRVLTPELSPGVLEEIDQQDGMARVRHVAWSGQPSVLSTWYEDISVLSPLPLNFVQIEPSPEMRVEAAQFMAIIEDALEGMFYE